MKKLKFIDLFGAPGGMSLGFMLAGMKPIAVLDIFEYGLETYKKNFSKLPKKNIICGDVSSNDRIRKFSNATGLGRGDVDVIIGGPPCQGFSVLGRIKIASLVKKGKRNGRSKDARFIDDKRNHLYKAFIKFVDFYKPKAIVMENVPGMLSYKNGAIAEQIQNDFKKIGYSNVKCKILNAVNYGVPQKRKRIFFIATRKGAAISWPKRTHFEDSEFDRTAISPEAKNQVTVWDALGDLPFLRIPKKNSKNNDCIKTYRKRSACDFQKWIRGNQKKVHNNVTRWHRKKDVDVFDHMKPGEKWYQLSNRDRKRIGYSDKSFEDKWKRLPKNEPSWTVVSHLHKDGYMYIHPTQNRTISVREAARLQSFPDNFIFEGSRTSQFKQIGNAVPPLLAMKVAKEVKKTLEKNN